MENGSVALTEPFKPLKDKSERTLAPIVHDLHSTYTNAQRVWEINKIGLDF